VLSTFAPALIMGSPFLGWLANRFGRRPVLLGCSLSVTAILGFMTWHMNTMSLSSLYVLFFFFFLTSAATGPIVAAVSKELFPIAISGTSVGIVNLFPFLGAAIFQVLIGAVLTAQGQDAAPYAPVGFRHMFLICLSAAILSLGAGLLMKETLPNADCSRETQKTMS
jgi:MFS family permease